MPPAGTALRRRERRLCFCSCWATGNLTLSDRADGEGEGWGDDKDEDAAPTALPLLIFSSLICSFFFPASSFAVAFASLASSLLLASSSLLFLSFRSLSRFLTKCAAARRTAALAARSAAVGSSLLTRRRWNLASLCEASCSSSCSAVRKILLPQAGQDRSAAFAPRWFCR